MRVGVFCAGRDQRFGGAVEEVALQNRQLGSQHLQAAV